MTESQEWMAKQYAKDADYWGQIDPKRWNAFYKWLYQNKLSKTDLTGKGYNTKYLSK